MAGVVGAVQGEVPQRGELRFGDAVEPGRIGRRVGDLDVVRGSPGADPGVCGGGQVRAEVVADYRDADRWRVQRAQVAAELQEPGLGLARLDVPVELVLAQFVGGEQVPDAGGAGVGGAQTAPRRAPWFLVLAADRGPVPAGPGLQIQRAELIQLCGRPHRSIYADTATMPRVSRTVRGLAGELGDEVRRLGALRYDDGGGTSAPSVAAAFELSYRQLDESAARMFRLLPVNPGPDTSTAAGQR